MITIHYPILIQSSVLSCCQQAAAAITGTSNYFNDSDESDLNIENVWTEREVSLKRRKAKSVTTSGSGSTTTTTTNTGTRTSTAGKVNQSAEAKVKRTAGGGASRDASGGTPRSKNLLKVLQDTVSLKEVAAASGIRNKK